jgi:ArsR family transcriptional regulator
MLSDELSLLPGGRAAPPEDVPAAVGEEGAPSRAQLFARLPDDVALDLAEVFGVLADSTRLKIIAALMGGEVSVRHLAVRLGLRQSAVSHQLRLLRNLRMVSFRKEGRTVHYRLRDDHVSGLLRQALEHILEDGPRTPERRRAESADNG